MNLLGIPAVGALDFPFLSIAPGLLLLPLLTL